MKKRSLIGLLALILTSLTSFAQEVEMADELRQNGRIFVVVVVIGIIVLGLYAYLFYLDKQIDKLEKSSGGK